MSDFDLLVVGAGLTGSTVAERAATLFGANVLLIDQLPHLAGSCYDTLSPDGLLYQPYGPHVFHTNASGIVEYLSAFTEWRQYEHRELARVGDRLVPFPFDRTLDDDRCYLDRFQVMPTDGFSVMVDRMTDHPRIERRLGVSYEDVRTAISAEHVVFTGPIDGFFSYQFGRLPFRYRRYEFETLDVERYQDVACVNEPGDSVPYIRTIEFKHSSGQIHPKTIIAREYPADRGHAATPIDTKASRDMYRSYAALAEETPGVTFVGRLAEFCNYEMDQAVAAALRAVERLASLVGARS